jgi:hypothetical protein
MAFAPNSTRLQRTYRVTIIPVNGQQSVDFTVNLTYDVDAGFNAVNDKGIVVPDSLQAHLEAVNRLRRLADKGIVGTTRRDIDDAAEWEFKLIRERLLVPS